MDKYADDGIATIEADMVSIVQPFTDMGRPGELIKSVGGRPEYLSALKTLERELYATSATQFIAACAHFTGARAPFHQ